MTKLRWGIALLGLMLAFAVLGPWLTLYSYEETTLSLKNLPPSSAHWLGTDELGRDLLTRAAYGARISLFVGITAAAIDLLIGVLWGGLAGYLGHRTDELMMRFADLIYGLPYLLVVILVMVALGPGLLSILIAMTITGWIPMARIVRGQVLQLKSTEYVLAAQGMGAGAFYVLTRHILPNASGPILVTVTMTIPSAVFTEAFLSFLGLGVQAPIASWGTMASDALGALRDYPWRLFVPSACISWTLLAFTLISDGLSQSHFTLRKEIA